MKHFRIHKIKFILLFILLIAIFEGCRTLNRTNELDLTQTQGQTSVPKSETSSITKEEKNRELAGYSLANDPYQSKIQKIFDNRCVACHSCYNAPCQLQLVSYNGVMRGANKKNVHDVELVNRPPSRLDIDAHNPTEWQSQKYNFFPVIESSADQSVLLKLVNLGKYNSEHNVRKNVVKAEESKQCPMTSEYENYKESYAQGMPYGLPPLQDEDQNVLKEWIEKGALGPSSSTIREMKQPTIDLAPYEEFLNLQDMKHRLVARYIFEHLFLAHIFFEDGKREYYRLIRAKPPTSSANVGDDFTEVATARPTDSPEGDFKYKFIRITNTITQKTHVTYKLDSDRLARWNKLFFQTEWTAPEKFPTYDMWDALNPYLTFGSIPAKVRYQFLLDDTYYYIKTFILGPVCRGQLAVDSIDDHFWAFFLSPDKDPMLNEVPEFLKENSDALVTAGAYGNKVDLVYGEVITTFRNRRAALYEKLSREKDFKFTKDMIWNGGGERKETNVPLLTIMRHFESASVNRGGIGGLPKTIWVVDYHLLEELYYNLVAGFEVFAGNFHRVRTRIHMDGSRLNGQDLFLAFLPQDPRMELRNFWHLKTPTTWWQGLGSTVSKPDYSELPWKSVPSVAFSDLEIKNLDKSASGEKLPKLSLAFRLQEKLVNDWMDLIKSVKGKAPEMDLDCCSSPTGSQQDLENKSNIDLQFRKISRLKSVHAGRLPDVMYVRVKKLFGSDLTYSIITNKEHYNLDHMFEEKVRRSYRDDYLTVHRGFVGSHPNIFLEIPEGELASFVDEISSILKNTDEKSEIWKKFYSSKWIVSRFNPKFWETYDFFNQAYLKYDKEESGIIDLTRYLSR